MARERLYGPTIVQAFLDEGMDPALGLAIARQESAFRADSVCTTGGDGARGGSYGLMQMSLMTARTLGFIGPAKGLLAPGVNAGLAAALCKSNSARSKQIFDLAAMYNSGKVLAKAPKVTATKYVPAVLRYYEEYKARYFAGEFAKKSTST